MAQIPRRHKAIEVDIDLDIKSCNKGVQGREGIRAGIPGYMGMPQHRHRQAGRMHGSASGVAGIRGLDWQDCSAVASCGPFTCWLDELRRKKDVQVMDGLCRGAWYRITALYSGILRSRVQYTAPTHWSTETLSVKYRE
jgi:hypothetical protein